MLTTNGPILWVWYIPSHSFKNSMGFILRWFSWPSFSSPKSTSPKNNWHKQAKPGKTILFALASKLPHKVAHFCSFLSRASQKVKETEVAQLCLTLCNPLDCSLPGSSFHGIFQARILEWVAISFSRGSSRPRGWIRVSHTVGRLALPSELPEAPVWLGHFHPVTHSPGRKCCDHLCKDNTPFLSLPESNPTHVSRRLSIPTNPILFTWGVRKRLLRTPTVILEMQVLTTLYRFPCSNKASVWKQKRDAYSALQELFCRVFLGLLLQLAETPGGLPSRMLTPNTEDLTWGYFAPFSLFLQRKALDPQHPCKRRTFFLMTTK